MKATLAVGHRHPIARRQSMIAIESSEVFNGAARGGHVRRVAAASGTGARCQVHVLPSQWAAVVRFRSALDQLPRGFFERHATLAARLIRSGCRPFGFPFAIFGKSDDDAVDVELGLLVETDAGLVDGVELKRVPEGLVVTLTHAGPYEQIGASYFELLGWMDDRSLMRDGPFMEIYLDAAESHAMNTRIVVPVCARARSSNT
jgi:hypothetical protein